MSNSVVDELEIRNLVSLYADAVNRVDKNQWAATWADESEWVLPGIGAIGGKENIVGLWEQAMAGFDFVAQLVYQGTVVIDGETANGRWYLSEHLRLKDSESGMFNIGTYSDSYEKQSGIWLFKRRDYHILYNDEGKGDMSGQITPLP